MVINVLHIGKYFLISYHRQLCFGLFFLSIRKCIHFDWCYSWGYFFELPKTNTLCTMYSTVSCVVACDITSYVCPSPLRSTWCGTHRVKQKSSLRRTYTNKAETVSSTWPRDKSSWLARASDSDEAVFIRASLPRGFLRTSTILPNALNTVLTVAIKSEY